MTPERLDSQAGEKLKKRGRHYPWDEWLDGEYWKLRQKLYDSEMKKWDEDSGDFGHLQSFKSSFYRACKLLDLAPDTWRQIVDDDGRPGILIRALPKKTCPVCSGKRFVGPAGRDTRCQECRWTGKVNVLYDIPPGVATHRDYLRERIAAGDDRDAELDELEAMHEREEKEAARWR